MEPPKRVRTLRDVYYAPGIHMGSMAASITSLIAHYGGVDTTKKVIEFKPRLPPVIKELCFRVQYMGQWMQIQLSQTNVKITMDKDASGPIPVMVKGQLTYVQPGTTTEFAV